MTGYFLCDRNTRKPKTKVEERKALVASEGINARKWFRSQFDREDLEEEKGLIPQEETAGWGE